jgi:sterol 14-demethylase
MPGITAALSSALAAIPVPAPVHAAAENIADTLSQVHAALGSPSVTTMLLTSAVGLGTINYVRGNYFRPSTLPPKVPSQFPWLGCIFAFGERPIDFLLECTKKYGPVFSFVMFGTEVTYCIGSEASAKFWGSHNDILNAEDLYANITVPVFGPGVAYAVEHKIFSEQKQMAKEGLSNERFAAYTSVIEQETNDFIDNWGKQGSLNFFETMAGMIIFTATRCLHGQETRDDFDETVAGLYSDLDGGFTPAGWFLPPWLPLPSFRRRDRAHRELKQRFYKLLDQRRANNVKTGRNDLMETYMTTPYKKVLGGRLLNDVEVSGMMIALLMAGQHTSSTVSSWMMSFICTTPGLQEALYEEQVRVFKDLPGPLSIEHLNRMPLLHATVRETLRLRPPIMSIMRRAREDFEVTANGRTYVIPKGL